MAEGGLEIPSELMSDLIRSIGREVVVIGTACPPECPGHVGHLQTYLDGEKSVYIDVDVGERVDHEFTRIRSITLHGGKGRSTWTNES